MFCEQAPLAVTLEREPSGVHNAPADSGNHPALA